jgi:trigger factor
VVFHVKCNEIKFEELPEIDDEVAQDNDFDTVADMRADAKERLHKGKETVAVNAFNDRLVKAAADNMTADIPASMIEAQMDSMVEEYSNYIGSQGIPFEQYVKMMGGTVETFRETTRTAATAQVRQEVLLDAVAQAENLEAAEEDIKAEIEKLAQTYSMKAEEVEKYVDKEALAEQIVRRKATAVITDSGIPVAPKAAEPAAEE